MIDAQGEDKYVTSRPIRVRYDGAEHPILVLAVKEGTDLATRNRLGWTAADPLLDGLDATAADSSCHDERHLHVGHRTVTTVQVFEGHQQGATATLLAGRKFRENQSRRSPILVAHVAGDEESMTLFGTQQHVFQASGHLATAAVTLQFAHNPGDVLASDQQVVDHLATASTNDPREERCRDLGPDANLAGGRPFEERGGYQRGQFVPSEEAPGVGAARRIRHHAADSVGVGIGTQNQVSPQFIGQRHGLGKRRRILGIRGAEPYVGKQAVVTALRRDVVHLEARALEGLTSIRVAYTMQVGEDDLGIPLVAA